MDNNDQKTVTGVLLDTTGDQSTSNEGGAPVDQLLGVIVSQINYYLPRRWVQVEDILTHFIE